MPIYASHNFTENFLSAIGADDSFMNNELIVDEIAKLIIENKRDVVDILRNNNINASIRDCDVRLGHILTKYIASDAKVRYDVASFIRQKSVNMENLQKFISELDLKKVTQQNKEGKTRTKTVKAATAFGDRIRSAISKDNQHESMNNAIAKSLEQSFGVNSFGADGTASNPNSYILQERIKMNQMAMNADGDKPFNKKKIAIIAGVVIILGIVAYFAYRKFLNGKVDAPIVPPTPSTPPMSSNVPPTPNV